MFQRFGFLLTFAYYVRLVIHLVSLHSCYLLFMSRNCSFQREILFRIEKLLFHLWLTQFQQLRNLVNIYAARRKT